MKSKSINVNVSTNNSKTISRDESNRKVQALIDKLSAHFKLRLGSLMAEKNYKYSNMVIDIGSYLRKLGINNFETESIIPRLEKYLLEILAKMPSDNYKYITEISKINQILQTEVNNKNNYYTPNPLIKSANNCSKNKNLISEQNIDIKRAKNLIPNEIKKDNLYENYVMKSLPNKTSVKNIETKPGAHLAINQKILNKSEFAKNKVLTKTNSSRKNIVNIKNKNNNLNSKNEKMDYLVTETNKSLNDRKNDKYNTNENYYLTENNHEASGKNENPKSIATRSTSTKINNKINNDISKKTGIGLIQKTEKLNELKEKAMDEWAMIVKYNHLKHLEEEQNKKNLEEEKKRKVREILENQMKEKDQLKKLKQEEDKKFFKIQSEKIENMEKDHFEKEKRRLEKIKQQKETQEKLIKEHQDNKNEMRIKDKIKDKIILEKIKHDLITEEEKLNAKKQNDRDMYLNIIKENEQKAELKKKAKETEKLENKKALEEYSNLIEKQERERLLNLQNKIVKSNNNYDLQYQRAKKNEELLKQFEEQKFLKEKEEIEIKKKQLEESDKNKKQKQIYEIKHALKSQIDEKKRVQLINKIEDQKYNEIVKNNNKKFVDEKENQLKTYQSKVIGYKELLDQQLNEKGSRKYHMDEKEKQFNKELIGKIYSEFVE